MHFVSVSVAVSVFHVCLNGWMGPGVATNCLAGSRSHDQLVRVTLCVVSSLSAC